MSKPKKDKFYLVQEDILPEAIKKTIKVKEILKLGEVKTINEAVEKMDLSRSAYYKYKDYVFPFFEIAQAAGFNDVLPKSGSGYSYFKVSGGLNQKLDKAEMNRRQRLHQKAIEYLNGLYNQTREHFDVYNLSLLL